MNELVLVPLVPVLTEPFETTDVSRKICPQVLSVYCVEEETTSLIRPPMLQRMIARCLIYSPF